MNKDHVQAFSAIISGRVQVVMYRDFAQRKARSLGIVGEVENIPDGTVRIRAEGEKENLDNLIEFLKRGPVLARVDNVEVQWVEPGGGFAGFSIKY
jgi:acylphosphatase